MTQREEMEEQKKKEKQFHRDKIKTLIALD